MGQRERKEHDSAWGLNFGDPNRIRMVPEPKKSGGLLKSLFGGRGDVDIQEHRESIPMKATQSDRGPQARNLQIIAGS